MQSGSQPKRYEIPPGLVLDERQRYAVPEASAILRQCESKTWRDIREGKLQTIKDGGRTYVSGASLILRSTPSASTQAA